MCCGKTFHKSGSHTLNLQNCDHHLSNMNMAQTVSLHHWNVKYERAYVFLIESLKYEGDLPFITLNIYRRILNLSRYSIGN